MVINFVLTSAVLALIAGVVILIWPKALNLAVGLWLVINGALGIVSGYV